MANWPSWRRQGYIGIVGLGGALFVCGVGFFVSKTIRDHSSMHAVIGNYILLWAGGFTLGGLCMILGIMLRDVRRVGRPQALMFENVGYSLTAASSLLFATLSAWKVGWRGWVGVCVFAGLTIALLARMLVSDKAR